MWDMTGNDVKRPKVPLGKVQMYPAFDGGVRVGLVAVSPRPSVPEVMQDQHGQMWLRRGYDRRSYWYERAPTVEAQFRAARNAT